MTTLPIGSTQAFTAMATASDGTSSDATGVVAWGPASDGTVVNNGGGSFTGAAAGSDMITATLTGMGVCAGGNAATTTVVGTASLTVTPAAVASITVDTAPTGGLVELPSGESRQLQVLATLTDGTTNVDVTSLATFVAGAPSIASVSATGLVTGNTAGVGSINVSYAPTSVTATPITFTVETCGMPLVGINEVGGNIAVGQSELFTATAVYGTPAGCTATLTERTFDATAGAAWASSNTTAATIVSGGANAGKLTALAAGTTNVTAAYKGGTSPIVVVTPIAVTLSTLTITAGGTVPKGGSETVTVAALWSDGGHYPAPPVSWAVADNTVLTIDGSNVLHGVAVGSTTYVAQSGSVTSNTLTGNVSAACISSITLSSPTGTTLPVGVPFTVAFSCTTSDNSVLPCAPLFGTTGADIDTAFFTGSAAFATSGQARIGATGAGTVTATISAVNGGCGLGVAATPLAITGGTATLQSIALTPGTANIAIAAKQAYSSVGTYSGGTGANTYDLSSVAPLASNNGTVTANALAHDQTKPSTVTAVSAGTSNVTSSYGVTTSNVATVTVNTTKVLQSIAITADENLVGGSALSAAYPANGYTLAFHATGTNNDASSTGDITSQVAWTLTAPILTGTTISNGGVLTTGTAAGVQVVTATLGSISASFNVTIDAGTVSAVDITSTIGGSPATSVASGAQAIYAAQAHIGGSVYWVTGNFTWASSNTGVGTIVATGTGAGTLTAVAATGNTNVTATRGALTGGPLSVAASNATPTSVACVPAAVSVTPGSKAQLRANVTFSDGSVVEETTAVGTIWTSPTPGTAAFQGADPKGVITGVAAGSVTISPSFGDVTATLGNSCVVTVN